MAPARLALQLASRVLGVSGAGSYDTLIGHIRQVRRTLRGTSVARRVRAESDLGQGIAVEHQAVERLFQQRASRA